MKSDALLVIHCKQFIRKIKIIHIVLGFAKFVSGEQYYTYLWVIWNLASLLTNVFSFNYLFFPENILQICVDDLKIGFSINKLSSSWVFIIYGEYYYTLLWKI